MLRNASGSAVVPFALVRVSICDAGFMGLVKRAFVVAQLYMREIFNHKQLFPQ